MSPFEKAVVIATYIGQLLFVPTAMWALTQPSLRLEMHRWTGPIVMVLTPISLLAVILICRDLYKRQLQNKGTWLVAIFLTGGIGMIAYTFIHAFRPRIANARV